MNPAMIEPVLELILSLVGGAVSSGQADKIIAIIQAWLPVIIDTLPNLYTKVKTIISLLTGNSVLTQDQIDAINAMNLDSDTANDAALAQAQKEV